MPFTKPKHLVRENPERVAWERELRKFLRKLPLSSEHRIAAVHVYEWATGIRIADLVEAEQQGDMTRTRWRADLRKLNELLREYFGKGYITYIMGRKVKNAYKVPKGWKVKYHRPKTLTLYGEWYSGQDV